MINLVPRLRRHRALLVTVFDAAAWVLGFVIFAWLRLDQDTMSIPWAELVVAALGTAAAYTVVAWVTQLHRGRASTASLEEMVLLGVVVLGVGAVSTVTNMVFTWIPRSIPAGATLLTLVLSAWGRAAWRRARERSDESLVSRGGSKVVIVGGGDAGRELIASMLRDPAREWEPVAILDDDPAKSRRRVRGIPVMGTTDTLAHVVAATGADSVVIAIPSADAATIDRIRHAALEAEVGVKVLPSTTQLLTDHVGIRDIRDVNLTDVLGRNQLDTDIDAIAGYLTGRRVLVTGAGGSIGSELCRQIHRFAPSELMMLDRDESGLHAVQLSIAGRAMLDSSDVILCDIRDVQAVDAVFAHRRPEVVFHAAALKHLPMLEQYPVEAVKTNVVGTHVLLEAADRHGVGHFINISTDKAANPCSVLGYSKRVAEGMTAARSRTADGCYLSVRFGNVLGSRGSVLTAFAKQIAAGGPVTVTHPDVTRYFMTIEEACQLVIQAAAIGRDGEALVLDMGQPVRIIDVAKQLMDQSGRRVRIDFTGLREGEKLHEELFGDGEPHDVRPVHPQVSHVPVPPIDEHRAVSISVQGAPGEVRDRLAALCEPAATPTADPARSAG